MSAKPTLLSDNDIVVCKSISSRKSLEGKRANALLAINDGKTTREAGEDSGLTYGQVKYLLQRFRSNGMSIFPGNASVTIKPDKETEVKKRKSKKEKKSVKKKAKKKDKKNEKKKNKKKDKKSKKKK